MTPRDGDYVVINSQWSYKRYEVRRVTKLTPQMYFYDEQNPFGRTESARARIDEILFATSDEQAAKRLSEKLKSSDAHKDDEQRKAIERWIRRNADLIESAKSCPSHLSEVRGSDA